jgi:hypothetical protein
MSRIPGAEYAARYHHFEARQGAACDEVGEVHPRDAAVLLVLHFGTGRRQ